MPQGEAPLLKSNIKLSSINRILSKPSSIYQPGRGVARGDLKRLFCTVHALAPNGAL